MNFDKNSNICWYLRMRTGYAEWLRQPDLFWETGNFEGGCSSYGGLKYSLYQWRNCFDKHKGFG